MTMITLPVDFESPPTECQWHLGVIPLITPIPHSGLDQLAWKFVWTTVHQAWVGGYGDKEELLHALRQELMYAPSFKNMTALDQQHLREITTKTWDVYHESIGCLLVQIEQEWTAANQYPQIRLPSRLTFVEDKTRTLLYVHVPLTLVYLLSHTS